MSESVPAAAASPLSDTADARVVLSRIVKKTAVARRAKNDTGNPRADHTNLITCVVGGTVLQDCPRKWHLYRLGCECPRWIPIRAGSMIDARRHQISTVASTPLRIQSTLFTEGTDE